MALPLASTPATQQCSPQRLAGASWLEAVVRRSAPRPVAHEPCPPPAWPEIRRVAPLVGALGEAFVVPNGAMHLAHGAEDSNIPRELNVGRAFSPSQTTSPF